MTRHSNTDRYPQFIVIGAVKAATTWIQKQLQHHKNVFMPDPEPHFFSRDFDKGPEFYRQFFVSRSPQETIVGEKSADYLSHPLAAGRIASMLPDVRLVLQLRDPVARAYSDYKMLYRRGEVKGQPEEYLMPPGSSQHRFLLDGLYGQHLERWFDLFPSEHILTLLYEEVATDPRATVERVCTHIGVQPQYDEASATHWANNSREKILPLPLRSALAPLKRLVRPLRGRPLFEASRSLFAREPAYPPLSSELEEHLRNYYLRDIEGAEKLIGRDLSAWKRRPLDGLCDGILYTSISQREVSKV